MEPILTTPLLLHGEFTLANLQEGMSILDDLDFKLVGRFISIRESQLDSVDKLNVLLKYHKGIKSHGGIIIGEAYGMPILVLKDREGD